MKYLFAAALLATALFAADAPQFAGQWKIHSNIMGNESDIDCTFKQKDAELSGACKGEQGDLAVTGKVEGSKATWQFNTEYQGEPLTVVYSGTIEAGSKITGSVDVQPMNVSGEFTAVQAK